MSRQRLWYVLIGGILSAALTVLALVLGGLLSLLGDEVGASALWRLACSCGLVAVLIQFLLLNLLALRSLRVRMGS